MYWNFFPILFSNLCASHSRTCQLSRHHQNNKGNEIKIRIFGGGAIWQTWQVRWDEVTSFYFSLTFIMKQIDEDNSFEKNTIPKNFAKFKRLKSLTNLYRIFFLFLSNCCKVGRMFLRTIVIWFLPLWQFEINGVKWIYRFIWLHNNDRPLLLNLTLLFRK